MFKNKHEMREIMIHKIITPFMSKHVYVYIDIWLKTTMIMKSMTKFYINNVYRDNLQLINKYIRDA